MKQTLYLMRHGQTLFNEQKRIQGWCDSPLTELGKKQAMKAKEYFDNNGIIFDAAYASTSERACDTLEIITEMAYTRMKGLKEWNFGSVEGESEAINPPLPYGDFFQKYYGGESEIEVRERMAKTLKEIMDNNHNSVLVVSHGASCRCFMRYWEKNQQIELSTRLYNCCILKFEYENGEFSLVDIINHNFEDL